MMRQFFMGCLRDRVAFLQRQMAACEHYHACGVNYQKFLKIYAGDLDKLCVHMTYVQLSLIGAKAEVSHQDSISGKVFEMFITPMCFIQ